MIEFLKNTVEYRQWGMNALTISFLFTLIFTGFQWWSYEWQKIKIVRNKSGEGVSVILFAYWIAYLTSLIVYGTYKSSLAMLVNGFLYIPCIFILIELWKYKGFAVLDIIAILCFAGMPVVMFVGENKDTIFLMFLFGILAPMLKQVYEILDSKDASDLDPRSMIVFMATNVFWFIYALKINHFALRVFNPISFLIFAIMLMLWKKYGKKNEYN